MSKRKNRQSAPNIPQVTLDRARQELGMAANEPEAEAIADVADETPVIQFQEPPRVAIERRPRTSPSRTASARSSSNRKEEKFDMAYIRNRLANPTRIVTEAQLREEYSYVVNDLRSMGILAALLIVALVVIEKIV